MKTYYVYILICSDDSYYTGITNNTDKRTLEHNNNLDKISYTYSRRPVKLVYKESFQNPNNAIKWGKRIKGWSPKKKEALIKEDFDEIKRLSNFKKNSSNVSTPDNYRDNMTLPSVKIKRIHRNCLNKVKFYFLFSKKQESKQIIGHCIIDNC